MRLAITSDAHCISRPRATICDLEAPSFQDPLAKTAASLRATSSSNASHTTLATQTNNHHFANVTLLTHTFRFNLIALPSDTRV